MLCPYAPDNDLKVANNVQHTHRYVGLIVVIWHLFSKDMTQTSEKKKLRKYVNILWLQLVGSYIFSIILNILKLTLRSIFIILFCLKLYGLNAVIKNTLFD